MLGSQLPAPALVGHLLPLLAELGIPAPQALAAASLTLPHPAPTVETPGPAAAYTNAAEAVRRAEYLVAAGQRFKDPAHSVERERANLARHLYARGARLDAGHKVDEMARRHGPVLGWYSILDARTTTECRAANGADFDALRPPLIGWPGTLHGGTCRCRPGAPHRSGLTVDEATAAVREHAVIPFAVELAAA